jgi:hypothetical protein
LRIIQRDFCAIEIKCSLIPPHFIEVLVPSQGSELSGHVLVIEVSILPLFIILLLDFGQCGIFCFSFYGNIFLFIIYTSVDTEMCCPKGKCGCQYFILLT